MQIEIVIGNIVRQPDVDVLVNSANANLRVGSGITGAIHTAAGPELEQYCRRYSPIALGEAVVTPGFQLPNPFVIHVGAASYINDDHPEKYLDLAIAQALRVAKDAGIKSMATLAIGAGVFKFPPELAVEIFLKALLSRAPEFPAQPWLTELVIRTQLLTTKNSEERRVNTKGANSRLHLS
jgi:O-acetyl-ADP-ribose deacetylase (regulator of RNase III)